MGPAVVEGITVTSPKRIPVPGGDVLHVMKKRDNGYVGFGEAYFSFIEPGVVKAWKRHLQMTLNLVVPIGDVRFVFIDESGAIREEEIGESRYVRLTVPPRIWFGFQAISARQALLLNIADIEHVPDEIERRELSEMNYSWEGCS